MKKNKRLRQFTLSFTAAIVLVLVVGGATFYTLDQQAKEEIWVQHTYKVLTRVDNIEQLLVDMETGRRGFRCTNDVQFLEPYYKSQPKLAGSLEQLQSLVADNARQVINVQQLADDIFKIDTFWKGININTIYHDEVQKRLVTLNEKKLMDQIRVDIKDITNAENLLLTNRESDSSNGLSRAMWSLGIGIILILLIVVNLIKMVISSFKSRLKAELALKDKLSEVEKINAAVQKSNWVLTGIQEINGSLIGSDSLKSLIENCLLHMTRYMNIPAGAFYFFNAERKELNLTGAVALAKQTTDVIKLNEGITGHAATLREISVTTDLPDNYWRINSATGGLAADTLIFVPLWVKKELKGVIELACFKADIPLFTELLKAVADNIAIAVHSAHANEQMSDLLMKVQDQKEELESQQEELRQTNEELIHQTDVLLASEEELKTQEEELKQINVEMEEKTEAVELARAELARKADELEISSKYKSEFLANMSHELRTPLNSVLILASLLKDNKTKNLTDKQAEYAKIIHKSGSDLLELINDILDLSKIEAGKVEVFFEETKTSSITQDMEQLFTVLAQQKKINFFIKVSDQLPEIFVTDKQRLEQILKNLLSNAFKFTPEQGNVSLEVAAGKASIEFSVTDSGIGISEEKQQLIFEAFQQADGSTSRKFGGTGLGLSISKELVKILRGKILLKSVPGSGSTFTIILPLSPTSKVTGEMIPDTFVSDGTFDLSKMKEQSIIADDKLLLKAGDQPILIIEDDPVFAQHVHDFAHEKGYKTIIAMSGDEGLHYARTYAPAAIILDLGLPVIDGRNLLKILKSDNNLKNIPVHLVTAEDRSEVPMQQVAGYLQKPLKATELEQAFANIDDYITGKYKNILIVSPDQSPLRHMFARLTDIKNAGIGYTIEEQITEALNKITTRQYDCIIADIGDDIKKGIETLQQIKANDRNDAHIIICLDGDVSPDDEKQLKKYANSIIRKSTHATNRLLDEVELFLHKIKSPKTITIPSKFERSYDNSLSGKKVLLADDDMRNVFALSALLEEQGMEVIAAENGKDALQQLDQNSGIDIVLMDIMMPEMDGYETIRHIRNDRRFEKLPVIALTAKAMTGDREKCLAAGASDYITKPVDHGKLFSLMRVWLAN